MAELPSKTGPPSDGASNSKYKEQPPTYAEATVNQTYSGIYPEVPEPPSPSAPKQDVNNQDVDVGALLPVPPDGGYGWVIVIAAFLCNFVVDGTCNAFAQFIPRYVEIFKTDTATVGFVGSCLIGAYLLVGPIVSGLTNKYGARLVVIVGSIIAGIAFLLSVFSPNIYAMIGLYGMIGGAGFGFIYLPAICVVCYYFEKKRSLATGLAVAGSGAGTIVMPPLCEFLLKNFGYKVTLMVLSGVAFSCVGLGVLYRPLKAPTVAEIEDHGDKEMQTLTGNGKTKMTDIPEEGGRPGFKRMRALSDTEDPSMRPLIEAGHGRVRKHTQNSVSSEATGAERRHSKVSAREYAASITKLSNQPIKGAESLASVASSIDAKEFAKPLNRNDIFYQGSIQNLPEFQKEGRDFRKYRESQVSIPAEVAAQALRLADGGTELEKELTEAREGCRCCPASLRSTFSQMLDVELLKDPGIILICVSNLFAMIGFYVPFMYMYSMALEKGIPEDKATWLLPIIGIFNTLGRIVSGWLADRKWLSALALNNISLVTCGLLTFICPYLTTYVQLLIYSIVFGFIISAYICLTSIVLTDLVGLEKLTNAFGILVVARAIACFIGTPLAGFVKEKTNSFDASFSMGATLILLGGFATCAISLMQCIKDRRAAVQGTRREGVEDYDSDEKGPLAKQ